MTITAVGTVQATIAAGATTVATATCAVGDLRILMIHKPSSVEIVDTITGGDVTNWTRTSAVGDTISPNHSHVWAYGICTSASNTSITLTWTGDVSAETIYLACQTFHSDIGPYWGFLSSLNFQNASASTTIAYASHTVANTGYASQMYVGFGRATTGGSFGTPTAANQTTGWVTQNVDSTHPFIYHTAIPSGVAIDPTQSTTSSPTSGHSICFAENAVSKLYWHRGASAVGGTLPATDAVIASVSPTWTPGTTNSSANTPLLTNFSMDKDIGLSAQTSLAYSTDNVTTNQRQPLLRFVSDPLGAQLLPTGPNVIAQLAASVSNTNSALKFQVCVALWRPGTGALVGRMVDVTTNAADDQGVIGTGQTVTTVTKTSTGQTVLSGDVLIIEVWRGNTVQAMGTLYTNTIFYDGTTEASGTNNASFVQFVSPIALPFTAPADFPPELRLHPRQYTRF